MCAATGVCALALLLLGTIPTTLAQQIVTLTDANFEHLTQVSLVSLLCSLNSCLSRRQAVRLPDAGSSSSTPHGVSTAGHWLLTGRSDHRILSYSDGSTCWKVLAQKAAETPESGVVIAEVDVSENPLTSKRFSITGLPTLAFIADGRVYEYRRKRTIAEMLAWARGVHRAVKTHVQFGFSQVNTRKTTGRTLLHHKAGYR